MRIICVLLLICISYHANSQDNIFTYIESDYSVTKYKYNTRSLDVNIDLLSEKLLLPDNIDIRLPLLNDQYLDVVLEKFSVLNPSHFLMIETESGQEKLDYEADFSSFLIIHNNQSIGTFIFSENLIISSFKYERRQFEINMIDNNLILFDVNDLIYIKTFSCEVKEKINDINMNEESFQSSSTPKCLELAIEIDKYTRNTFSSNISATNWAHALIAGVSQVYASEVNLNISIVTTIIWETTDPYASYVNNASNMLSALRSHWTSNNGGINRDLVHLMTKRTNTGTGGIAYRDVLCSNSWGYSFSANLNNNTNFSFPNPSYTWNLMVCSHEIGHNIESHHTHWCGWPGGPIDNCVDVEGNCSNNPAPQVGTIMSYCHTTSSGSLIDFHSIVVNNALNPGINSAGCITSCTFYGCTDPNATNYDPNATVDDGSCIYAPPVLSSNITNVTCNGGNDGSVDLSVTGGLSPYTYVWSNSSFSEDIFNLSSGTYTVIVTDALGQSVTSSYIVAEPSLILATYIVTNTTGIGMNNGSISVSVSGGTPPYTYYWVGYTSTSSTLSNLSAGTYVSYVLDAHNCYVFDSLIISDDIPIPINITSNITDVSCYGGSTGSIDISVSGGSPPYIYSWSNGSSSEDLFNLVSGVYILNVSDMQGQSIVDTIIINEPLPILLSFVVTHESYPGFSDGSIDMTVSGGVPPFNYFWNTNPSQTTEDLSNITEGDYIVYVGFDNWTCFISDTVSVYIAGCTDSLSINFDPYATINDGSCIYNSLCSKPTPTGIFVDEIIHDRARVHWDNMTDSICLPKQYRIYYRQLGTSSWSQKNALDAGLCNFGLSTTSKLLNNLTPNTFYEYKVKAWYCNTIGSSTWSILDTFITDIECPNVDNFSVSTPLNTRATFNWNDSNGQYSFVRIKMRVDSISIPTSSDWFNVGGFGTFYPIFTKNKNGLTAGQTYRAQARTWCDPNGGRYKSMSWTPLIFWTQPTNIRIQESSIKDKKLIGITDILGRKINSNMVKDFMTLFYIYDDGSVEVKIIRE